MRKFNITVNGKSYEVDVEEIGGSTAAYTPAPAAAPKAAPAPAAPKAAPAPAAPVAGATNVTAPMPGTVVSVKVKVGDTVKEGDLVCILEAMKMENEIFANGSGKVVSVSATAGASVNSGDVLVSIA
ncbi:MAG: biotin/lipoyl-binding protein [Oscillospiraceae bacterium]|nr:biotin/lipoyl-binding protein [Oscillospiraceae bacterium]